MPDLLTLDGYSGQATEVRFELVSPGLSSLGDLDVSEDSTATVDLNINRSIKRQLTGVTLPPSTAAAIDPFRDRLRPVWRLSDPVTREVVEYPLGVFTFASLQRRRARWHPTEGLEGEATLGDYTVALDQVLDRSVAYPAGTPIEAALAEQAGLAGIYVTDIESTGRTLGTPLAWVVGRDTRLKVVNELAAAAGLYSPWFDNTGVWRARTVPDLGTAPPTFNYDTVPRILDGSIVETDDALQAPNRYLVVDTSASAQPISAFYDVDASAPHSVLNRGYAVPKLVEVQGLSSIAAAYEAARAAALQDTAAYSWLEVQTVPEPRMDTYDVVLFDGLPWRVQSWKLPLTPGGPHAQSWRRVYTRTV